MASPALYQNTLDPAAPEVTRTKVFDPGQIVMVTVTVRRGRLAFGERFP
jgi:hypothetical protein